MNMLRRVTASAIVVTFSALVIPAAAADVRPAGGVQPDAPAPTQLISNLESGWPDEPLFDMHGNANPDLQGLMILRFGATKDIMESIDRMEGDPRSVPVRAALYGALGFVKDPSSIEWLREKRRSDIGGFHSDYLPTWMTLHDGFGSWKWLTGRDAWIAFWRDAVEDERSLGHRLCLLRVLYQFDDASVQSYFIGRRNAETDPKEVLLVEGYLAAHAMAPNDERIARAVGELSHSPHNDEFLTSMAGDLRHEALVPFLVSISDRSEPNAFPAQFPAERALQAITFQCNLHGKGAWQSWYAKHGTEGREAWRRRAIDDFKDRMARDRPDAARHFETLIYCWNDLSMLPFVEATLAPYPEFHSAIAGWINLTYTDFDHERLRPLAARIGAEEHLADWARRLLQERGYLPGGRSDTWAETVARANSRL